MPSLASTTTPWTSSKGAATTWCAGAGSTSSSAARRRSGAIRGRTRCQVPAIRAGAARQWWLLKADLAVRARTIRDLARTLERRDAVPKQPGQHLQPLFLRAELEQTLFQLRVDLDARRHLVGAQRRQRSRVGSLVGDLLEQVRVSLTRLLADLLLDIGR